MFAQLLESFRKVSESSLNAGQEMFKQWVQQAQPQSVGPAGTPQEWPAAFQKRWAESAAEALNKHRELVDATYKSGIEVIEQTFRVGEARSLGENRRLMEELWRKDVVRGAMEVARESGALYAMMSSAGPSVFAIADGRETAERVSQALESRFGEFFTGFAVGPAGVKMRIDLVE